MASYVYNAPNWFYSFFPGTKPPEGELPEDAVQRLGVIESQVSSVQQTTSALQESVSSLRSDMGGVVSRINQLGPIAESNQSSISSLNQQFQELRSDVATLATIPDQVQSIRSEVSTVRSEVSSARSSISANSVSISSVEEDVRSLRQQLSNIALPEAPDSGISSAYLFNTFLYDDRFVDRTRSIVSANSINDAYLYQTFLNTTNFSDRVTEIVNGLSLGGGTTPAGVVNSPVFAPGVRGVLSNISQSDWGAFSGLVDLIDSRDTDTGISEGAAKNIVANEISMVASSYRSNGAPVSSDGVIPNAVDDLFVAAGEYFGWGAADEGNGGEVNYNQLASNVIVTDTFTSAVQRSVSNTNWAGVQGLTDRISEVSANAVGQDVIQLTRAYSDGTPSALSTGTVAGRVRDLLSAAGEYYGWAAEGGGLTESAALSAVATVFNGVAGTYSNDPAPRQDFVGIRSGMGLADAIDSLLMAAGEYFGWSAEGGNGGGSAEGGNGGGVDYGSQAFAGGVQSVFENWVGSSPALQSFVFNERLYETVANYGWEEIIEPVLASRFSSYRTWLQSNRLPQSPFGRSLYELIQSIGEHFGWDQGVEDISGLQNTVGNLSTSVTSIQGALQDNPESGLNSPFAFISGVAEMWYRLDEINVNEFQALHSVLAQGADDLGSPNTGFPLVNDLLRMWSNFDTHLNSIGSTPFGLMSDLREMWDNVELFTRMASYFDHLPSQASDLWQNTPVFFTAIEDMVNSLKSPLPHGSGSDGIFGSMTTMWNDIYSDNYDGMNLVEYINNLPNQAQQWVEDAVDDLDLGDITAPFESMVDQVESRLESSLDSIESAIGGGLLPLGGTYVKQNDRGWSGNIMDSYFDIPIEVPTNPQTLTFTIWYYDLQQQSFPNMVALYAPGGLEICRIPVSRGHGAQEGTVSVGIVGEAFDYDFLRVSAYPPSAGIEVTRYKIEIEYNGYSDQSFVGDVQQIFDWDPASGSAPPVGTPLTQSLQNLASGGIDLTSMLGFDMANNPSNVGSAILADDLTGVPNFFGGLAKLSHYASLPAGNFEQEGPGIFGDIGSMWNFNSNMTDRQVSGNLPNSFQVVGKTLGKMYEEGQKLQSTIERYWQLLTDGFNQIKDAPTLPVARLAYHVKEGARKSIAALQNIVEGIKDWFNSLSRTLLDSGLSSSSAAQNNPLLKTRDLFDNFSF